MAAALWIVAGVWYLVAEAVTATQLPGYSYSRDYISDLGRPVESPMAAWMNLAFIAQGVAFALAGVLVVATMRTAPGAVAFLVLALIYGAGSAMVGVFPSGGNDVAAAVHFSGATAAILCGNLAVITGGLLLCRSRFRVVGGPGVGLGVTGLFSGALLLYSSALGAQAFFGDGVWERGAVYPIIGWQLLAGAALVVGTARPIATRRRGRVESDS